MKTLIFALIITLGLSSCSKDLDMSIKKSSKWVLSEWPGKSFPTKVQATLNITDANKIGGKSFCNSFGGNATFNGNALKFSQIFSTKMFCQEVADAEVKYLTDLEAVNSGRLEGGKLYLMKDGEVLLVFSKADSL